jgi:hypothetical protein
MLCMCVCASRRQALKTETLNEVLPINRITLNLDEFDSIPKPDMDCSWSLYSAQVGDVALKILGLVGFLEPVVQTLARAPTSSLRRLIESQELPTSTLENKGGTPHPFEWVPSSYNQHDAPPPPSKPRMPCSSSCTGFQLSQPLETLPGEILAPLWFFRRKPHRKPPKLADRIPMSLRRAAVGRPL